MNRTTLIILGIAAIVLVMFAGLLPLPGQKDNVTTHTQPSTPGTSPRVEAPSGPPTSPTTPPGQATPPPP